MRSPWPLLASTLLAATLLAACREYMPTNRYLRPRPDAQARMSTADARRKFRHGKHAAVFARAGVACLDCHRFDVRIDTGNEELARDLSKAALHPGSAPCHACHREGEAHLAGAPGACTTCHENLLPLRPENHEVAWLKVHSSAARAQPAQCENCHRQSDCITCHERRDTIQTVVHDRNFRFFHSVVARANPMQCGSCHRQDYCINCHQQGKGSSDP